MKKVTLVVLDGVGVSDEYPEWNAMFHANTPNFDRLFASKNYAILKASGRSVGVLEGQMGNSEVGHMTIWAGRAVLQSIVEINDLFETKRFEHLPVFTESIAFAREHASRIHILGLLWPSGVHAHTEHIIQTIQVLPRDISVCLHVFSDGRDSDYDSAYPYLEELQTFLTNYPQVSIASLSGRYFAMDRDNNWERTSLAYETIVMAENQTDRTLLEYISDSYQQGIYDEFMKPVCFDGYTGFQDGDVVYFMNFRSDRARQLTQAVTHDVTAPNMPAYVKKDVFFVSMTPYYEGYTGKVFVEKQEVHQTLSEVFDEHHISHLHIAETEKYAHVTKFFNGGRKTPCELEKDLLIPSHKVATYDLDPDMSAEEIYLSYIESVLDYGFSVLNFANGDMVGHTGNMSATVQALETLDHIIGKMIDFAKVHDIVLVITADHGNCEEMGTPESHKTSHTLNPVPCFCIQGGQPLPLQSDGTLADVAPTILDLMGIEIPEEMTGKSLLRR